MPAHYLQRVTDLEEQLTSKLWLLGLLIGAPFSFQHAMRLDDIRRRRVGKVPSQCSEHLEFMHLLSQTTCRPIDRPRSFFSSAIARVVNDLPGLLFIGCDPKGVATTFWLNPHLTNVVRHSVIECHANDFYFRMLIVHRGFYVSMAHRAHDGGQVPGPHKNPSAVVMSGTIKNEFLRKAGLAASRPEQAID